MANKRKRLEEYDKISTEIEKLRTYDDEDMEKIAILEGKKHLLEECAMGIMKNISCSKVREDIINDIKKIKE